MNITRRDVEDTIKENREECMLMKGGGDFSRRKKLGSIEWERRRGMDG
jgi:hypothetical protein